MNQAEVNKIITEKVLGEEWSIHWDAEFTNPDFSQWSDYGPLLEKIQSEEWWGDFHEVITFGEYRSRDVIWTLLNPARGSLALAEFVVAHPEIFEGKQ